ncbi:MAG TPA: FG-GAP repeat protein [Planctomycetota bacterium]|nr:FG-GAP repeat protein [Planctomycetota bacterium]
MVSRLISVSFISALALAFCPIAHSQTCNELQQLVHASSGSPSPEHFGSAVDMDGDYAVVGAYQGGSGALGQAYVYVRSGTTWSLQATLSGTGLNPALFGESVAISGDTIVVGAPIGGGSFQIGTAYVFVRSGTTWTQQAVLSAGGFSQPFGLFGSDVDIDGNRIMVGAPNHTAATASGAGMCFAFTRTGTTWSAPVQIISSSFQAGASFGGTVSLQGTKAMIGAPNQNSNAGSVFDFSLVGSTWTQMQQLNPTSGAGSMFGISVDLSGTDAAIGAWLDDTAATNAGAAYVFTLSGGTWSQQAKLTRNSAAADDQFGTSVALSSDGVLVGMNPYTGVNPTPGGVFQFLRNSGTWFEGHTLVPVTNQGAASFGVVARSGSNIIVGAPNYDSSPFTDLGTAYIFALAGTPFAYCTTGAPCGNNYVAGGCINNLTTNVGARLLGCGTASISSNDFGLNGVQFPSGGSYIPFLSPNVLSPLLQSGNGLLALNSPITRLGAAMAVGTTVPLPNILSDSLAVASGQIVSGNTIRFQIWYRNPAVGCDPANTNFSNGYEVTLVP